MALRIAINGFGRIGRQVAARCRAFDMTVLAYDPYISTTYFYFLRDVTSTLEMDNKTSYGWYIPCVLTGVRSFYT